MYTTKLTGTPNKLNLYLGVDMTKLKGAPNKLNLYLPDRRMYMTKITDTPNKLNLYLGVDMTKLISAPNKLNLYLPDRRMDMTKLIGAPNKVNLYLHSEARRDAVTTVQSSRQLSYACHIPHRQLDKNVIDLLNIVNASDRSLCLSKQKEEQALLNRWKVLSKICLLHSRVFVKYKFCVTCQSIEYARFEVFTVMKFQVAVFWVVTPSSDVVEYQCFEGLSFLQLLCCDVV
jgi:hypothetical protein